MSITDEKLKAAIQIALGSHGIYTEKIESDLIHHIKALSIHCRKCNNTGGYSYTDKKGFNYKACECH